MLVQLHRVGMHNTVMSAGATATYVLTPDLLGMWTLTWVQMLYSCAL